MSIYRGIVFNEISNLFTEEECIIFGKHKTVKNIEIGIYNYTIEYCIEHNIPKRWECEMFKSVYLWKFKSVYDNLTIDSYKNKLIKKRMLKGELLPHELVFNDPQEQFVECRM